jgi:16S rRNA G1207 methylase RsmC
VTADGDDRSPTAEPAAGTGQPQYFADDPAVASDPVTIDVSLADTAFTLETDRGVFARGRLDDGTSLLLRTERPLASVGNVLDVGCGAGPIALAMARRSPGAIVWAVDVNERARALCTTNAAANGATNVRVIGPDAIPDAPVDLLWSNPPIRIGKAALHDLLKTWLGRLADDGRAVLVVQKHLGSDSLLDWLNREGFPTDRLSSAKGYRLLRVRPRTDILGG